jgi:hypothetical protein
MLRPYFGSRDEFERKMAATRQMHAEIAASAVHLLRRCAAVLRLLGRALRGSLGRS